MIFRYRPVEMTLPLPPVNYGGVIQPVDPMAECLKTARVLLGAIVFALVVVASRL